MRVTSLRKLPAGRGFGNQGHVTNRRRFRGPRVARGPRGTIRLSLPWPSRGTCPQPRIGPDPDARKHQHRRVPRPARGRPGRSADRFDLQTEIWRGRILGSGCGISEKARGGRTAGAPCFLQWAAARPRDQQKPGPYGLIQLADRPTNFVGGRPAGACQRQTNFSERPSWRTAQAGRRGQAG